MRSEGAYRRVNDALEWPMLVLSLAFVPVWGAPYLFDLQDDWVAALDMAGWAIWAAFVVEYVLLLGLAPSRRKMVASHKLDLVIIAMPFLRPLRALRILRVAPALVGLARGGVAARRIASRPGFRGFLAVALALIVACAAGVYALEAASDERTFAHFGDALWWAIVTATTVGYGDHYPVTGPGRGVAVVLMLVGVGIFSVVTANVAAFFVEDGNDDADELRVRLDRIERMLADHAAIPPERPHNDEAPRPSEEERGASHR